MTPQSHRVYSVELCFEAADVSLFSEMQPPSPGAVLSTGKGRVGWQLYGSHFFPTVWGALTLTLLLRYHPFRSLCSPLLSFLDL